MIKTVLKVFGLLFGFLLFLSIEIKEKPIFTYIYKGISPATRYAQEATESFFGRSVASTQVYSKKLFDNSIPNVKGTAKSFVKAPSEKITDSEKEELDQLIKNHR